MIPVLWSLLGNNPCRFSLQLCLYLYNTMCVIIQNPFNVVCHSGAVTQPCCVTPPALPAPVQPPCTCWQLETPCHPPGATSPWPAANSPQPCSSQPGVHRAGHTQGLPSQLQTPTKPGRAQEWPPWCPQHSVLGQWLVLVLADTGITRLHCLGWESPGSWPQGSCPALPAPWDM